MMLLPSTVMVTAKHSMLGTVIRSISRWSFRLHTRMSSVPHVATSWEQLLTTTNQPPSLAASLPAAATINQLLTVVSRRSRESKWSSVYMECACSWRRFVQLKIWITNGDNSNKTVHDKRKQPFSSVIFCICGTCVARSLCIRRASCQVTAAAAAAARFTGATESVAVASAGPYANLHLAPDR